MCALDKQHGRMAMTTKGTWHRPEGEPGAYASGYDRIFGKLAEGQDDRREGLRQPVAEGAEGVPSHASAVRDVQPDGASDSRDCC